MKKVLIIEDEILNAKRLIKMLQEIDEDVLIDGPLLSVPEVIDHLSVKHDYDVIFSDIRLNNELVFDAFSQLDISCFVVFTTAYQEYGYQAIKNNGIDYLLKPYTKAELERAYRKALEYASQKSPAGKSTETEYKERILVSKGEELVPVSIRDINYIYSSSKHTMLCLNNGNSYVAPMALNELEPTLNPKMFFRLNRQYIANINAIEKISLYFMAKLSVRLAGCEEAVLVSKERSVAFKEWLAQ